MVKNGDENGEVRSAHSALEGYWYQLHVSILFALDLLASKQATDQIVLEPASEEDLEAEVKNEPGALTQNMLVNARQLVVQCKLRGTGPWKVGDLARLLAHGERRKSAKERLKDPKVNYLLVTSADLDGVARNLAVTGPRQWQHLRKMPATVANHLPAESDGRVAVWSLLDAEKVGYRIERILTERFRVPTANLSGCIVDLEREALIRMKGGGDGIWTREEVIQIINAHEGYDGVSRDLETFVPPANWNELQQQLKEKNAIVIMGPSGTGKTTTAKALVATLREMQPNLRHVRIDSGPESIRTDMTPGSVVYEIEDPWGTYRAEPEALPWNHAISELLTSATADRQFVVTSRSDVLEAANLKTLDERYTAELLGDHYRREDRNSLFDNRLSRLPRGEQISANKWKATVIEELLLPLEIDRFFGRVGLGPLPKENEPKFMRRCIAEAKQEFIERSLVLGIRDRSDYEQTAIVWARKLITFGAIEVLEPSLYSALPMLEDKVLPLVEFLVAGGNLKQSGTKISYSHPRVEAGLENAILEKPRATSRVVGRLIEALVCLDETTGTDWGVETAVQVSSATSSISSLKVSVSASAQKKIDGWLEKRLCGLELSFKDDLVLAANAGSKDCYVAELARWLDTRPIVKNLFDLTTWEEPLRPQSWYDWISSAPCTHVICATFIEKVIGFENWHIVGEFHHSVAKLSSNLTPAFRAGLSGIVGHGYRSNAETLISGAIADLDGFEPVLVEAADVQEKSSRSHERQLWLAICNRDYDDDAAEHYTESAGEDGHTASEILKAYVAARRSAGEWHMLSNHPRRSSLVWSWTESVSVEDGVVEAAEWLALGQAAQGHGHEDHFWDTARKSFASEVIGFLRDRLKEGSKLRRVRVSAARTALKCEPELIRELLSSSSALSVARMLELAIDVHAALETEKKTIEDQRAIVQELTADATNEMSNLIGQVLGLADTSASPDVLEELLSIPIEAGPELNLAISTVLARNGKGVVSRIEHILISEHDVESENIELVVKAMRLAVTHNCYELVSIGLAHEFAGCRIVAMDAVLANASPPLPDSLLEMRRDSSSLVRERLVQMMKKFPHADHTESLIDLTLDTWTPDHHLYGGTVNFPIASAAAELLLEQASLTEDDYKKVVKSLKETGNNSVRLTLLRAMVRHGSPARCEKIIQIAIGEGRPTYQQLSAQALYLERDRLEDYQLEPVKDEDIIRVSPLVACWLTLLLTESLSDERVLSIGKSLAVHSGRRALIPLMLLSTQHENRDELNRALTDLLPSNIASEVTALVAAGSSSSLMLLNELGDVDLVEEVKFFFRLFYE